MKCSRCGQHTPLAHAVKFEHHCPSCNGNLVHEAKELLSDPALGLVSEVRPGQVEMAVLIDEMFQSKERHTVGMAEGGCGLGKSYAYMLPALTSGMRVVIATAKKSLQDQLDVKDLPALKSTLGVPRKWASIKGKSNYICRKLLAKHESLFEKKGKKKLFEALTAWAKEDPVGDTNTFHDAFDFPATLCTAEECNKSCRYRSTCGYLQVKARAKEADVVVVNHALLGYDLRLGVGRIFGPYEILVIDEAHAVPDYLRRAFANELSPNWMRNVFNKLVRQDIDYTVDRDRMENAWEYLFSKIPEEKLLPVGFFGDAVEPVDTRLGELRESFIETVFNRWIEDDELDEAHRRPLADVFMNLESVLQPDFEDPRWKAKPKEVRDKEVAEYEDFGLLVKLIDSVAETRDILALTQTEEENFINCREEMPRGGCKVVRQPVNLAPLVAGPFAQIPRVLFTSATLNIPLLQTELGQKNLAMEVSVPSPFPYNKSLVYLPKHLPRPDDRAFHEAVAEEIMLLIRASKGNALVLFSSLWDLERIRGIIEDNYETRYNIFAQEKGRRPNEIFTRFLNTDNSVLFGSKSFFEGIDVKGGKLRLVILVKIPFPPREDPLNKAKQATLGKRFWREYYFPNMLNDIQQGVGRLVRTADDRGVVAILDVRIWVGGRKDLDPREVGTSKRAWSGYGHQIIKALPFPNFTPRFELVQKVFKGMVGYPDE